MVLTLERQSSRRFVHHLLALFLAALVGLSIAAFCFLAVKTAGNDVSGELNLIREVSHGSEQVYRGYSGTLPLTLGCGSLLYE
jgi:hypothetical protein